MKTSITLSSHYSTNDVCYGQFVRSVGDTVTMRYDDGFRWSHKDVTIKKIGDAGVLVEDSEDEYFVEPRYLTVKKVGRDD